MGKAVFKACDVDPVTNAHCAHLQQAQRIMGRLPQHDALGVLKTSALCIGDRVHLTHFDGTHQRLYPRCCKRTLLHTKYAHVSDFLLLTQIQRVSLIWIYKNWSPGIPELVLQSETDIHETRKTLTSLHFAQHILGMTKVTDLPLPCC